MSTKKLSENFISPKVRSKKYFYKNLFNKGKLKWKTVMDCLPVGIIIASNDKKIKHVNQEMKKYCGVTLENSTKNKSPENLDQSVNKTQQNILIQTEKDNSHSSGSLDKFDKLRERSGSGTTLKTIIENTTELSLDEQVKNMVSVNDQKVYEVKSKLLPDIWPKGYMISVVKDQTVYEQLVKEKILEKYQRMLLSSISHEIRNPLNEIEGYSSMIAENSESKEIISFCRKLELSVQKVDYILTGACDLMVNDTCCEILQTEEFDVKVAVQNVIDIVKPSLEMKPVKLTLEFNENIPLNIYSDAKKYKMILYNLLSNAIKYTKSGEIMVKLEYDRENSKLRTIVNDTGIGIKSDALEKIFELYSNIENANPYNPQGMGLSLNLCRKLSKALGGKIEVISDYGLGSTFAFTVLDKFIQHDMPDSGNREDAIILSDHEIKIRVGKISDMNLIKSDYDENWDEQVDEKICRCPKVLIVDDEPTNRLVLKSYLDSQGILSDEAENGKIAIELVRKRLENPKSCCKKYSLILMDINMPEMDGTHATEILIKIFKENKIALTNILAVTAASLQARVDIQRLLEIGFADVCIFFINENYSTKTGFKSTILK